jgi:hypothetical protein
MNTVTSINWARTKNEHYNSTLHTGTRSGWTFAIHTPLGGKSHLTATHKDGRRFSGSHMSLASAKQAAIGIMHPAEAMAWVSNRAGGGKHAVWGNVEFRFWRSLHDGRLYVAQFGSGTQVQVECFADARMWAVDVLEELYGPIHPKPSETAETAADGAVTALESALRAAGIRFTPRQLAIAALALA